MLNRRLARRFFGVALFLMLAAVASRGLEAWRVVAVRADVEAAAAEAVTETERLVQTRTAEVLAELADTAIRLADDAVLRRALADTAAALPTQQETVLARVHGTPGAYGSVEVYRADGALLVWDGFTAPLGPSARRGLPKITRSGVVLDGTGRRLLAHWQPVFDGERHLGTVRTMRVAQVEVPVRNEYLQDYDIADAWRADAPLPFAVAFTGRRRAFLGEPTRLASPEGATLGWLAVPEPSEAGLIARVRGEMRDVIAFWLVLLVGWLLFGGWMVAERTMRSGRPGWIAVGVVAAWMVVWWASRYGLLLLDVPARWIERGSLGAAPFDPLYLASDVGGGLLRSAGDLAITSVWAGVTALVLLRFGLVRTATVLRSRPSPRSPVALAGVAAVVVLSCAAVASFVVAVRYAVLDATLGYFARSGPVPSPLTLLVLASIIGGAFAVAGTVSAVVLIGRAALRLRALPQQRSFIILGVLALAFAAAAVAMPVEAVPMGSIAPLLLIASITFALFLLGRRDRWAWPLTFRGMLVCVLVIVPLVYVLMLSTARERSDAVVVAAADDFAGGQDRRAVFALEQVLVEARGEALRPALVAAVEAAQEGRAVLPDTAAFAAPSEADDPLEGDTLQATLDGLVGDLVAGSLLASLAEYDIHLSLFSPAGDTLAATAPEPADPGRAPKADLLDYEAMRDRYSARADGEGGIYLARVPVEQRRGTYRYAGVAPLRTNSGSVAAWLYARVAPRLLRYVAETPFPRVLVPAGLLGDDDEAFAYAEYDDGVLVRSRGSVAGPSRLPEAAAGRLADPGVSAVWLREEIEGRGYRTYYRRLPTEKASRLDVVAVRAPTVAFYDHLFFLLRLTVAGLAFGLVLYALGVPARRRAGLLPAPRSRFRDKVLTRFLLVGIGSVALTGVIGQAVIAEQNRQAVRDVLRQRLARAEAEVTADAGSGTRVAAALEGVRADAVAQRLGVDLHVYRGADLVSTSRPQLVRQRLIDPRLPAEVWRALFAEGRRYAFAEDRIGSFAYTTGYAAVVDEGGVPIGAVAVPTLPEQTAIEAEQARMIAYLFGALLLLLLAIFVTTALLANQLTRPFRRLRAGLQAVGAGQMDEPLPVEGRDEMGELVETFNRMQGQLADSRQRLAQQERELAWREMARQVAHEIKNPLTPMKLSVQHLRRAHEPPGDDAPEEDRRFAAMLDRITTTLIEQIDALNRIAGEFSSFARLPRRRPETLDLNSAVEEAAALFEDEAGADAAVTLKLDLAPAALPVEADGEELRRAFINLFKNALQAMPEGVTDGRIYARTWRDEATVWAEVEDTGTGIPAEVQEKIFQPNFSTKTSGMGLGLAITQKAVEASGGTITFRTVEGEGTTFTLRLPLAERTVEEGIVAPKAPPGAPDAGAR